MWFTSPLITIRNLRAYKKGCVIPASDECPPASGVDRDLHSLLGINAFFRCRLCARARPVRCWNFSLIYFPSELLGSRCKFLGRRFSDQVEQINVRFRGSPEWPQSNCHSEHRNNPGWVAALLLRRGKEGAIQLETKRECRRPTVVHHQVPQNAFMCKPRWINRGANLFFQ